jgi:hypothetical protein
MGTAAKPTRAHRTITVDFRNEATYFRLLEDGKAFLEFVFAFILSMGFQLTHKATCGGGGCLTRHSHYVRVRLGGITIWRVQCTRCQAVFTVLPHFVLRYRQMRPAVARDALLATHGGLSLELCASIYHISPMAVYRLVCAFGHQSLVAVLTRCGLPLPVYFLADEKHSHCRTEQVYLPTMICGRVIWHLGYTEEASAAALTQSYGEFQRAAFHHEPSYRVRGILTDGFDRSCTSSLRIIPSPEKQVASLCFTDLGGGTRDGARPAVPHTLAVWHTGALYEPDLGMATAPRRNQPCHHADYAACTRAQAISRSHP